MKQPGRRQAWILPTLLAALMLLGCTKMSRAEGKNHKATSQSRSESRDGGNLHPPGRELIPIPNGDFENGAAGWNIAGERGDCGITTEHAAGGKHALRIAGDLKSHGAKVESPLVPCKGPGVVELHGKVCAYSGEHLGLWIREYDADGNMLPSSQENWGELGGQDGRWRDLLRQVILDERTASLQLFFLAYPREDERIEVYVDDLSFVRVRLPIPPWPSQYKLKPEDRDRLTAADVVGPDGVVYPNWKQVGVQGGIPDVPVVATLEDYGAKAETDISDALQRACREVGDGGGGAILIGKGTFYLDRPVTIRQNGVVIRGCGREKTRLVFRYHSGKAGSDVWFYWPPENGRVGPDTQVAVHAWHRKLKRMTLLVGEHQVASETKSGRGQFAMTVPGEKLLKAAGSGPATLRAKAEYANGRTVTAERKVFLHTKPQEIKAGPSVEGVLYFAGKGLDQQRHFLAEDGKRSDTTLVFKDTGNLGVGQKIDLHAPMTDRFCNIIRDRSPRGWNRVGYYEIVAIEGNSLKINQPLRIDYPVVDGTYARRMNPIERCGVEDLTIEHLNRLPIDSVRFNWGWNCWARNVKVVNTGRNGIYATHSKWIEVRDCELDGAWNNDGGQAYAGFTRSADCLFENCVVRNYRHGPVVQFGAMGCVFRNSTFIGSDLQWHAGWSTENLFENCVVNSYPEHGSYGFGAYATGSNDMTHGPNGPRNVVYNCDFTSEREGVMLNGVNENWLFLHNRFVVKKGAGFRANCGSFDAIIRHNIFVLRDDSSPMLSLDTPDCVGYELIDNILYGGNGKIYQGAPALAVDAGNKALPAAKQGVPPRPEADPPSIYAWQNPNASSPGR